VALIDENSKSIGILGILEDFSNPIPKYSTITQSEGKDTATLALPHKATEKSLKF
jgi:hypothetical protein